MVVKKNKFGLSKVDLWFDEAPIAAKVDIIHHKQSLQRGSLGWSRDVYTLVQPLLEDESRIFNRIHKHTQREIRRGNREGLEFIAPDSSNVELDTFCEFYNEFAAGKKRPIISASSLRPLVEAGMLKLTAAKKNGAVRVWHSYVYTPRRARLLHSASHFRASDQSLKDAIGRANRWLHWQDILYFKYLGLMEYDFGGWYEGSLDLEKLRINKFKEFFGANREKNYDIIYGTSLKGRIVLTAWHYYSKLQKSLLGHKNLPGWR